MTQPITIADIYMEAMPALFQEPPPVEPEVLACGARLLAVLDDNNVQMHVEPGRVVLRLFGRDIATLVEHEPRISVRVRYPSGVPGETVVTAEPITRSPMVAILAAEVAMRVQAAKAGPS